VLFVGVAGALKDDIPGGWCVGAHAGCTAITIKRSIPSLSGHVLKAMRHRTPPFATRTARQPAGRLGPKADRPAVPKPSHCHFKPIVAGEVVLDSRRVAAGRAAERPLQRRGRHRDGKRRVAIAGHLNQSLQVLIVRGVSDHADGTTKCNGKEREPRTLRRVTPPRSRSPWSATVDHRHEHSHSTRGPRNGFHTADRHRSPYGI
jgi:adenosylhomocysteine nucleosidase